MTSLVAVQGVIALVGLASAFNKGGVSDAIVATIHKAVPGPAGQVLTAAVAQAHSAAGAHRYTALFIGLVGCLVTGATAMGQLERGMNRIYGVEQDRPTMQKYGLAFLLALSVGTLASLAFSCLAFGREILGGNGGDFLSRVWAIGRWPLGVAFSAAAITLLFRWSPRRCQPRLSWLAFGAGVSVLGWVVVTVALGMFYRFSSSFGQTYGPLAGMIALMVWCLLSSEALFFGAAVAAQLEAVRAGELGPSGCRKGGRVRARGRTARGCGGDIMTHLRFATLEPCPTLTRSSRPAGLSRGCMGIPATEGNRVQVLRNGDEIFPAMLDAIDAAEHTIDFLTFVYWKGESATRSPRPCAPGPAPACGSASCSTAGAPIRSKCA